MRGIEKCSTIIYRKWTHRHLDTRHAPTLANHNLSGGWMFLWRSKEQTPGRGACLRRIVTVLFKLRLPKFSYLLTYLQKRCFRSFRLRRYRGICWYFNIGILRISGCRCGPRASSVAVVYSDLSWSSLVPDVRSLSQSALSMSETRFSLIHLLPPNTTHR